MEAFDAYMAQVFEDRVVGDVQSLFPEEYEFLGEDIVRERVRQGCTDTEALGIQIEADIARFIYLMFLLAPDFAENARYPWVPPILSDTFLKPSEKLDALYAEARKALEVSSESLRGNR